MLASERLALVVVSPPHMGWLEAVSVVEIQALVDG